MFTNVVWATDGSENADRALEFAVGIAERDGAALHVVHIVEKFAGARVGGADQRADEPEIDDKIARQAASLRVDNALEIHVHMPRTARSVAKRIAELAQHRHADLIVVGTRGRSPVASVLVGSVTQQLLHVARCPVLAVPPIVNRAAHPDTARKLATAR